MSDIIKCLLLLGMFIFQTLLTSSMNYFDLESISKYKAVSKYFYISENFF